MFTSVDQLSLKLFKRYPSFYCRWDCAAENSSGSRGSGDTFCSTALIALRDYISLFEQDITDIEYSNLVINHDDTELFQRFSPAGILLIRDGEGNSGFACRGRKEIINQMINEAFETLYSTPVGDDGLAALTFDLFNSAISKYSPEFVRKALESKTYADRRGFNHLNVLDFLQITHAWNILREHNDRNDVALDGVFAVQYERFINCGMPVYLVQPDVLKALRLTDLPRDLSINDLKIPLPAMLVVFPKSEPVMSQGRPMSAALIGEIPTGTYRVAGKIIDVDKSLFSIRSTGLDADFRMRSDFHAIQFPLLDAKVDDLLEFFLMSGFLNVDVGARPEDGYSESVPLQSGGNDMLSTIIKLVMFMNMLPEQIKDGEFTRSYKFGESRTRRSVWSPRIIGDKFRLSASNTSTKSTSTSSTLDRKSPKMHWRRGHFKRVPHGEGRSERRRTWIQPTIVNAPP